VRRITTRIRLRAVLKIAKADPKVIDERVQEAATILNLEQHLDRRPPTCRVAYVTHDQTEAMTLGHRVSVMRAGVLQQVDTPERLYEHQVNFFVAGFIGSPA